MENFPCWVQRARAAGTGRFSSPGCDTLIVGLEEKPWRLCSHAECLSLVIISTLHSKQAAEGWTDHRHRPAWQKRLWRGSGHLCEPGASTQTQVGLTGHRQEQSHNPFTVMNSAHVITSQQRDSERGRHRTKDAQQLGSGSQECSRQLCITTCVTISSLWPVAHGALLITRTIQ